VKPAGPSARRPDSAFPAFLQLSPSQPVSACPSTAETAPIIQPKYPTAQPFLEHAKTSALSTRYATAVSTAIVCTMEIAQSSSIPTTAKYTISQLESALPAIADSKCSMVAASSLLSVLLGRYSQMGFV
jgi:hypothetical protein